MSSLSTVSCLRQSLRISARTLRTSHLRLSLPQSHHSRYLPPANTSFPQRAQQTRLFSGSRRKGFADVQETFNPNSIERESDEVDVCIVGGGKTVPGIILDLF